MMDPKENRRERYLKDKQEELIQGGNQNIRVERRLKGVHGKGLGLG